MEKILARWRLINDRLNALQNELEDDTAFWENEEYSDLFEERTRLINIFHTCKNDVDREVVKGSIRHQNKADLAKSSGKDYTTTNWITINPADGQEQLFIDKVKKFMGRPCMKGQYVFEQRGETDGDFHGLHIHALIENYPNLKRDILTQFKKFADKNHIKIMPCSLTDIEKRKVYMSGKKEGTEKQPKLLNDPLMRAYYSLDAIYTC